MKKELDYFTIEGEFGGNQEWFTNVVMYIGGCGAATACDCSIYLTKEKGFQNIYPYDVENLSKADYRKFSQIMKPYIRPRMQGVRKLSWFIEGFGQYLQDVHAAPGLTMSEFPGEKSVEEAEAFITEQIDNGMPIPCLLLHHHDREKFKDYIWHWFVIVGYEKEGVDFKIKIATYGEAVEFSLAEMWNTGFDDKGGLVKLSIADNL